MLTNKKYLFFLNDIIRKIFSFLSEPALYHDFMVRGTHKASIILT